jgi:hypothetical protein
MQGLGLKVPGFMIQGLKSTRCEKIAVINELIYNLGYKGLRF